MDTATPPADGPPATLRIGAFSRASLLSIRTLRRYHEQGLLVPAVVDPATGYRSYTADQLTDAAVVRRLRALDVPLEAVREVLDAADPQVTARVLRQQAARLEERQRETERAITHLQDALRAPQGHTPVHRRHEPPIDVVEVDGAATEAGFPALLGRLYGLLGDAVAATGVAVAGPAGASYPHEIRDDAPQEVTAWLPVATVPVLGDDLRAAGVRVGHLPGTEVAVLTHVGTYADLGDAYAALGAWIARHAVPAELPVRERYHVGPTDTDDPARFRTEVCWPVHGPATTTGR